MKVDFPGTLYESLTGIHPGVIGAHVFEGNVISTFGCVDRDPPCNCADNAVAAKKNLRNSKL